MKDGMKLLIYSQTLTFAPFDKYFHLTFTTHVITYACCWDQSLTMLIKGAPVNYAQTITFTIADLVPFGPIGTQNQKFHVRKIHWKISSA